MIGQPLLDYLLTQIPGAVAGGGAVLIALLPHVQAERARRIRATRVLSTIHQELIDVIRQAKIQVDMFVGPGGGDIAVFFKTRAVLIPDHILTAFEKAVEEGADLNSFAEWRKALTSVKRLQEMHMELVSQSGRPKGAATIRQKEAAYLRDMTHADDALSAARDATDRKGDWKRPGKVEGR